MGDIAEQKRLEIRSQLIDFEKEQAKRPQVALKVIHHFSPGVCARELHIPEGIELTGATHKFANLNTLSQGEMLIFGESGWSHVKAPYTVVSPPNTKRAALTLTDCIWTTYIGTYETDIVKIEAEFTEKHEEERLAFAGNTTLEGK